MREYIENLNKYLEGNTILHGHSGQVDENVCALERMCSMIEEEGDIVEIGFNVGHSSVIFLENTNKNVISFDICEVRNGKKN